MSCIKRDANNVAREETMDNIFMDEEKSIFFHAPFLKKCHNHLLLTFKIRGSNIGS